MFLMKNIGISRGYNELANMKQYDLGQWKMQEIFADDMAIVAVTRDNW